MILLAQAAAQAGSLVTALASAGGVVSALLYWSLSRNVALVDKALADKDEALSDAFDRIRALEPKLAVQEAESRHLREQLQLAERLDALHACRRPQD